MVEIDPLTGLPKELLAMEDIVREQQSIKVHVEKRRYGKLVTVIDGMGKSVDINDLAKQLKTKCATVSILFDCLWFNFGSNLFCCKNVWFRNRRIG